MVFIHHDLFPFLLMQNCVYRYNTSFSGKNHHIDGEITAIGLIKELVESDLGLEKSVFRIAVPF